VPNDTADPLVVMDDTGIFLLSYRNEPNEHSRDVDVRTMAFGGLHNLGLCASRILFQFMVGVDGK
jgi:hypothetical protein